MHVFLTGGTGFVGPPTLQALLNRGHTVLALARSDVSAAKLTEAGATQVLRGDVSDLESLREGVRQTDGVIHIAWTFSFTEPESFERAMLDERKAIEAMVGAAEGTGKGVVVANGTLGIADLPGGRDADERDVVPQDGTGFAVRGETEGLLKEWSRERGVRGVTVRLAPVVHGEGDGAGFVSMFGMLAEKNGCVVNPISRGQDGGVRATSLPAVHKLDAAQVFCLALEKGDAGAVYHATAENVGLRATLEAVARKKGVTVRDVEGEEGMRSVGGMGVIMRRDNPVSSVWTRGQLGWEPREVGMVKDIEANYFK